MDLDILVVMPVDELHKEMLKEAAIDAKLEFVEGELVTKELAQNADIIVGNVKPELIKDSKKLKLLQLNSAGMDDYIKEGVLPSQTKLCNASGAYGLAISEHMIGMLLCLMKKLNKYNDNIKEAKWYDYGPVTSIYGSKTLVVGLGDIGNEFAIRMNALGSKVTGIRRKQIDKPEYIEALYQIDSLYECLEEADIVATCLPGTKETYHLFDEEAFRHMKKGAYLINVGRGTAVDSDALYNALTNGQIAGAALDVTEPEPLPSNHPLWTAPNILITPHISGGFHLKETHNRIIQIACKNISEYLSNM